MSRNFLRFEACGKRPRMSMPHYANSQGHWSRLVEWPVDARYWHSIGIGQSWLRLVALWINSTPIEESYRPMIYHPDGSHIPLHAPLEGRTQLQMDEGIWEVTGRRTFIELVFVENIAGGLIFDLSDRHRVYRQYSISQKTDEGIHPTRFAVKL